MARILKSKKYRVRQDNHTLWYVVADDGRDSIEDSIYPRFKRVRQISLLKKHGINLMSCTCGSICRWGMPCPHSIAVLSTFNLNVKLQNVHYRWYKVLAYSIHDDDNIIDDTIKRSLTDVQRVMNSIVCPIKRSWIGFPLDEEQVLSLSSIVDDNDCNHDGVYADIVGILDYNIKNGPYTYQVTEENKKDRNILDTINSTNEERRNIFEVKSQSFTSADISSTVTTSLPTLNLHEDLKARFVSMWYLIEEKITSVSDLNYIRYFLQNFEHSEESKEFQKRFNSLWWTVEKKIETNHDFERLHSLLENFHLNDTTQSFDPSIVNSSIDMTRNKKRKKMFFER